MWHLITRMLCKRYVSLNTYGPSSSSTFFSSSCFSPEVLPSHFMQWKFSEWHHRGSFVTLNFHQKLNSNLLFYNLQTKWIPFGDNHRWDSIARNIDLYPSCEVYTQESYPDHHVHGDGYFNHGFGLRYVLQGTLKPDTSPDQHRLATSFLCDHFHAGGFYWPGFNSISLHRRVFPFGYVLENIGYRGCI